MSGLRLLGFVSVAAVAVLVAAAPASAQVDVFIRVNPSTIQAGYQVGVQASCGENLNPATVRSDAFGQITLQPQQGGTRLLTGSATVPASTRPGLHRVELRCANGSTASTELSVLDMPRPTRGPDTGGGGMAAAATGEAGRPGVPRAAVALASGGLAALAAGLALLLVGRGRAGRPPPQ